MKPAELRPLAEADLVEHITECGVDLPDGVVVTVEEFDKLAEGRPVGNPASTQAVLAGRPRNSRALAVSERPMIRLMRPPARTSSKSTSLLSLNSTTVSPLRTILPS